MKPSDRHSTMPLSSGSPTPRCAIRTPLLAPFQASKPASQSSKTSCGGVTSLPASSSTDPSSSGTLCARCSTPTYPMTNAPPSRHAAQSPPTSSPTSAPPGKPKPPAKWPAGTPFGYCIKPSWYHFSPSSPTPSTPTLYRPREP